MAAVSTQHSVEGKAPYHCIASTETQQDGSELSHAAFRDAQFSSDGTSVISCIDGKSLRSYVLPSDLMDQSNDVKGLAAFAETTCPTPIQSYAIYPGYQLQDLSTTLLVAAARDQPMKLYNALYSNYSHASYSLVDSNTEEFISPSSLTFGSDGRHFVAGHKNRIHVFDVERVGEGAESSTRLDPKGHPIQSANQLVKALSIGHDSGILAAGTLNRKVALVEAEGRADCTVSFYLPPDEYRGNGITGLKWSPTATYLYIAERRSNCIQVYDVRNLGGRVALLAGRKANTSQALGMDLVSDANGYELWAGGEDGYLYKWSNPGLSEGVHEHEGQLQAHSNPVTSTLWHPLGAVMATCSSADTTWIDDTDSDDSSSDDSNDEDITGASSTGTRNQGITYPVKKSRATSRISRDSLKIWATLASVED